MEKGLAVPMSCEGDPAPVLELAAPAALLMAVFVGGLPKGERALAPGCDSMGDVVAVEDPDLGWADI